jgi:prophage DNA circulation protein
VTSSPQASNPESDTPWGWIAASAILLVLALVIAGWAFGRRGASRKTWSAQALEATGRGTALHDAMLAELIAATSANRPERWSSIASTADELGASLQRLPDAPADRAAQTTQAALDAVGAVQSAITIARGAPAGAPLDEEAARTLRERLEQLAAALRDLRAYAERG